MAVDCRTPKGKRARKAARAATEARIRNAADQIWRAKPAVMSSAQLLGIVDLLRDLEWCADGFVDSGAMGQSPSEHERSACPVCGGSKPEFYDAFGGYTYSNRGHEPGCKMEAALRPLK